MRAMVWVPVLIVAAAGVLWVGGESWFAGQAQRMIAEQTVLDADEVRPLRDPRRIGIRIGRPEYETAAMSLALPWTDLWISPLQPQETRLTLPDYGWLRIGAREHDLSMQWADLRVRQSLFGGTMTQADLRAQGVALDGRKALDRLDLRISAAPMTEGAPAGTAAAYDATISVQDLARDTLRPLRMPRLPVEGHLSLQGSVRLWTDRDIAVQRLGGPEGPRLTGLQTEDLILQLGDHRARITGQLAPDADGRAEGELMIRTEDAQAVLEAAFDAGLLPAGSHVLVRSMLARLQRKTADGEFGLSLVMRDGGMNLGPVRLGPAPMFGG